MKISLKTISFDGGELIKGGNFRIFRFGVRELYELLETGMAGEILRFYMSVEVD